MCRLLPTWVVLRDLDNNFLAVIQVADLCAVPSLGSRPVYVAPFLRASTVSAVSYQIMFNNPTSGTKKMELHVYVNFSRVFVL